jgi:predicted ATPase/DNA-binding XRE family transcriptional regulator
MAAGLTFARRLVDLRIQAALTQEGLAERAGLSVRGISDLERGLRRPRADTLTRIARALHVDGSELAGQGLRTVDIPAPLDAFVGREVELVALDEEIHSMGARLVTLVGPPGVGKSRLARELAANAQHRFADGAAFVRLCVLRRTAELPDFLASQFGLHSFTDLKSRLAEQQFLLVLDNVEHLPGIADAIVILLEAAPGLTIVATGRASLNATGERIRAVEPLTLPPTDDPEDVMRATSTRLVVARAREQFALPLGKEHAAALACIVRQLDGLPLALELAVARLANIDIETLAASVEREVMVSKGPIDRPDHSHSLAEAVEWSLDALTPAERRFIARLAVFVGTFSVDAAAAVAEVSFVDASRCVEALRRAHLLAPTAHHRLITMLKSIRSVLIAELERTGYLDRALAAHERWYKSKDEDTGWMSELGDEAYHAATKGVIDNVRHVGHTRAETIAFVRS